MLNSSHLPPSPSRRRLEFLPTHRRRYTVEPYTAPKNSRTRSGCMTCRIRRKKCDQEGDVTSCKHCLDLNIECLGSDRPNWLKSAENCKIATDEIREFTADRTNKSGPALTISHHWTSRPASHPSRPFRNIPYIPEPSATDNVRRRRDDATASQPGSSGRIARWDTCPSTITSARTQSRTNYLQPGVAAHHPLSPSPSISASSSYGASEGYPSPNLAPSQAIMVAAGQLDMYGEQRQEDTSSLFPDEGHFGNNIDMEYRLRMSINDPYAIHTVPSECYEPFNPAEAGYIPWHDGTFASPNGIVSPSPDKNYVVASPSPLPWPMQSTPPQPTPDFGCFDWDAELNRINHTPYPPSSSSSSSSSSHLPFTGTPNGGNPTHTPAYYDPAYHC